MVEVKMFWMGPSTVTSRLDGGGVGGFGFGGGFSVMVVCVLYFSIVLLFLFDGFYRFYKI